MKVLLIHPRLVKLGGLEARLFNYADYFISKGHEVHIACRTADARQVKSGYNMHLFRPFLVPKFKRNFYFNQRLEKWKKPDFDFDLSLGRTTIQKNILAPATHKGYLNSMSKTELSKSDTLQIVMDKRGYDASENIFACSEMVREEVIQLYDISEEKVHVLYPPFNAVNHACFSIEEKEQLRKLFKLPSKRIYHLFISTSHGRKGLPLLLEAFKKLKDTPHSLLVIGNPIKTDLPNVFSLGFFKDTRIAYALGNYLLHPSVYEPYGQIVNEALHHLIPVIVSKNTGAGEILTPSLGTVAPDFNLGTWVDLVKELPNRTFEIPHTLMEDLGLDLENHMKKMLEVNFGISSW